MRKRRFSVTVASCGRTLQPSDPVCMVGATVVLKSAAACGEIEGIRRTSSGLNSQRFPNSRRIQKGPYGAMEENISFACLFMAERIGLCLSSSVMNFERRTIGEFFGG